MPYSDPLLPPDGFEGVLIDKTPKEQLGNDNTAFQGIVFTKEQNQIPKMPTGFMGLIIEYRPNEKIIKVLTSRNRVFPGCTVHVDQLVPFTTTTDSEGNASGVFDVSGTLTVTVTNGKVQRVFTIDASAQPFVTNFIFDLDYND